MTASFLRRCTHWLLALLVFAALQPAFAAVRVPAGGAALMDVCTSQGLRRLQVDDAAASAARVATGADLAVSTTTDAAPASDPSDPSAALHADHCPLCRVVADALPDATRADLAFAVPRMAPRVWADAPSPIDTARRLTRATPPRAPPAVSTPSSIRPPR